MIQTPLRYEISNWYQLSNCLSNASRDLKITVTDFIQNDTLLGLRISVVHPKFGVLFATVIDPKGDIVIPYYVHSENAMTDAQLLNELAKFGFFIQFTRRSHLSQAQLDYLNTLKTLHFDKLRTIAVSKNTPCGRVVELVIVAFKIANHPEWLANLHQISSKELDKALSAGSAVNISRVSETQQYDWRWLDFVADIDDILTENGYTPSQE